MKRPPQPSLPPWSRIDQGFLPHGFFLAGWLAAILLAWWLGSLFPPEPDGRPPEWNPLFLGGMAAGSLLAFLAGTICSKAGRLFLGKTAHPHLIRRLRIAWLATWWLTGFYLGLILHALIFPEDLAVFSR